MLVGWVRNAGVGIPRGEARSLCVTHVMTVDVGFGTPDQNAGWLAGTADAGCLWIFVSFVNGK